jgi:mannosyltransferase
LTIAPAAQSLQDGWHWLVAVDAHPPVYYALLHVWLRLFGDGAAAARSLSALCGTLALPLFFATARRIVDRRTALLGTFILAVSPFHVRFAQEVRMYAFITLAVAASLYLTSRLIFDQERRGWLWLSLALSETAVMLTHNTAVLFPLALNVGVLGPVAYQALTGRRTSLPIADARAFGWRWIKYQALALFLWLPWLVPLFSQTSMLYQRHWIPDVSERLVWRALENFSFSSVPRDFPHLRGWIAFYLMLAAAGLVGLWRLKARGLLLAALFVVPILSELLISLARPMFLDRTLIWATPAYYLLIAAGIRWLGSGLAALDTDGKPRPAPAPMRLARLGAQLALIAVVCVPTWFALRHYYFEYQKEEWATAARFVARRSRPGDVIVFNTILGQVPFEYYFRSYGRQVEMRGLPVDLEDRKLPEPTMTEADLPAAYALVRGRQRVWLVYAHEGYTDPDRLVWQALSSQMHASEERGFIGLRVVLFEAKIDEE